MSPTKFMVNIVLLVVTLLSFIYVCKYLSVHSTYIEPHITLSCTSNVTWHYNGWVCEDPPAYDHDGYLNVVCNGSLVIRKKVCSQTCGVISRCDYPTNITVYKYSNKKYLIYDDFIKINWIMNHTYMFIASLVAFNISAFAVLLLNCNDKSTHDTQDDIEMQDIN